MISPTEAPKDEERFMSTNHKHHNCDDDETNTTFLLRGKSATPSLVHLADCTYGFHKPHPSSQSHA